MAKRFTLSVELPFNSGTAAILFFALIVAPILLFTALSMNLLSAYWTDQIFGNEVKESAEYFHGINQTGFQCDGTQYACKRIPGQNETTLIAYSQRCNGYTDCPLADDEKHCMYCQTNFQCKSAEDDGFICLRPNKLCDGVVDCPNAEDETLSYCGKDYVHDISRDRSGELKCGPDEFNCFYKCIPKELACNGEPDCFMYGNAVDETGCDKCHGKARPCKVNGKCVAEWETCDGTVDCLDHSDEQYFHCESADTCPGSCSINITEEFHYSTYEKREFMKNVGSSSFMIQKDSNANMILCKDGEWRNIVYACSGQFPQCEHKCHACKMGSFYCAVEDRCLNSSMVCNGVDECADGSDEADCNNKTILCDEAFRRCDGVIDCDDGRDEINCTNCGNVMLRKIKGVNLTTYEIEYEEEKNEETLQLHVHRVWFKSKHKSFHCVHDQKCVPFWQRCDGVEDCSDGEDEKYCTCTECLMHPEPMYICQNGERCFKWDEVCDGKKTKCPNPTDLDRNYCKH